MLKNQLEQLSPSQISKRNSVKLVAAFCVGANLTACGSGADDPMVRLINATADQQNLDLTFDNADVTEFKPISAVGSDSQSSYIGVDASTYDIRLKTGASSSTLTTANITIREGKHYSVVAIGRDGNLRLTTLSDDESEPASNKSRVRVLNASADAPLLDVFVTEPSASIDSVSPTFSSASYGSATSFTEFESGTVRVRVTAPADKADLRLDLGTITLNSKDRLTIILQQSASGVLVHGFVSKQQGELTIKKNTTARVRVANGIATTSSVTITVGSTTVSANSRSPSIGAYQLVETGNQEVRLISGSAPQVTQSTVLSGGEDYTILATGNSLNPSLSIGNDDNRLPTASNKLKMRLAHGASELGSTIALNKDYLPVASGINAGSMSAYASVDANAESRLEVLVVNQTVPIYLRDDANLVGQGVYTVFVLGAGNGTQTVLRKDR